MGTPEHADDGEIRKYHATTESGEIIVELDDTESADNMSGEPFDYTVKVSVKYGVDTEFKEYSGCGEYIVDPRLHNIWIIEKFEGKEIDHTKFAKGVPQIEINVRDDVYMGHDGCNAFRGSIAFSAAKVTFSSGPSTLMACEDQPESGRISRELVAGALAVDFDNGRLNLSRDGNVVFVLKNVD